MADTIKEITIRCIERDKYDEQRERELTRHAADAIAAASLPIIQELERATGKVFDSGVVYFHREHDLAPITRATGSMSVRKKPKWAYTRIGSRRVA